MRSDELPLARSAVDRAATSREPGGLARALADPGTRVVAVRDGAVLVDEPGGALVELAVGDLAHGGDEDWLLLGEEQGRTVLARRFAPVTAPPARGSSSDVAVHRPPAGAGASVPPAGVPGRPDVPDAASTGATWASLRVVGATLSPRDAGLATTAVALDQWHQRHPRCPRCGAPTDVVQAGWVRRCREDGSEHYPRTDPAVIMAVVDDRDRILLGHAAAWPEGRYSTLAGFVESGESLESAVRREVAEETGVRIGDVEYRGSQPWPFPASLMVGFVAHALTTEVQVDGTEVTHARWFTRQELRDAVVAGQVVAPGRTSIARALVEDWLGDRLPEPADPALAWR
ncbi:NAD(+) diphosphatase [Cellulomonas fulva]|uniref:NAD(+) diphosphatase n=1 Tax=Cellulomonas fulva TaxID=2835530 RepID=UPI0027DE318E|nr:NAD(+) diphosphatase [Cellulomonas fulva]